MGQIVKLTPLAQVKKPQPINNNALVRLQTRDGVNDYTTRIFDFGIATDKKHVTLRAPLHVDNDVFPCHFTILLTTDPYVIHANDYISMNHASMCWTLFDAEIRTTKNGITVTTTWDKYQQTTSIPAR